MKHTPGPELARSSRGPGSIHRLSAKATYMKITIGVCGVDMRQLQQGPGSCPPPRRQSRLDEDRNESLYVKIAERQMCKVQQALAVHRLAAPAACADTMHVHQ